LAGSDRTRVRAGFGRLDLFDRAMALAAQLFSSVLPILIMMAVWVGQATTERFADAVSIPPVAQDVLEQALDESGGSAFSIVGAVFVLLSATSLSRALTRAMAIIWRLSRPKTQLTNAWRWVAVVVALALAVVVASSLGRFTDPIPPRNAWTLVVTFALDVLVAAFVPWLLLANKVPMRRLIPGAVVLALGHAGGATAGGRLGRKTRLGPLGQPSQRLTCDSIAGHRSSGTDCHRDA
jgi:membrane protein